MQNDTDVTIDLALRNIEELFEEPVFDPFDNESRFQSGIDAVVNQVRQIS